MRKGTTENIDGFLWRHVPGCKFVSEHLDWVVLETKQTLMSYYNHSGGYIKDNDEEEQFLI
jgi:hypothetical protein